MAEQSSELNQRSEAYREQVRVANEQAAIERAMDAANDPKEKALLQATYQRMDEMIQVLSYVDRNSGHPLIRHTFADMPSYTDTPAEAAKKAKALEVDQVFAAKMKDFWKIK